MHTNRTPLVQVLQNLVDNAIKHHDRPGKGRVVVSARDLGDSVEFRVSDDGPGSAPEHHELIFGVFNTLKGSDKEASGIGLAIVRKTIETYGGTIAVESQAGEGATFAFTWPK